jgi:hypothetical protein
MNGRTGLVVALISVTVIAGGIVGSLASSRQASAQVFGPPMTVFGSITGEGSIPEGVPVDAIIGNTICGSGKTEFYGGVPIYYIDVVSREQKAGCGTRGAVIRFKVGDVFANETIGWEAGPAELLLTIGAATPIAVPTPTPVTQETATQAPPPTPTPIATRTSPASPTATLTATPTRTATPTATPTLAGSLITRQPTAPAGGGATAGGDGGFPVWAAVVIGIGTIVAVGGGIGYLLARSRGEDEDAEDAAGL